MELSAEQLFLELPLYSKVNWERADVFTIAELLFYRGTIDCFCLECGKPSTFRSEIQSIPPELTKEGHKREWQKFAAVTPSRSGASIKKPELPLIKPEIYLINFVCSRSYAHKIQFLFKVQTEAIAIDDEDDTKVQFLEKVGQYPSVAALILPEIKKYRSVLSKELYPELAKGIGLASHDVGIGSYVYLRRVFERLVEDAHLSAKNDQAWDESSYQKLRMAEKIEALKGHLPEFLVSHSSLYSLLSKGLHELSEDECLKHFPVVRVGIEMILDQLIEDRARRKKVEEVSKAIGKVVGLISSADPGNAQSGS